MYVCDSFKILYKKSKIGLSLPFQISLHANPGKPLRLVFERDVTAANYFSKIFGFTKFISVAPHVEFRSSLSS